MQARSPAASPPAPQPPASAPCLSVPLPARSPQPATGSAGTPRGSRARRWREGEAGCSAASLSAGEELRLPFVSKSKHCPLLSRPRQRARHTGSHTSCSCRVLGVFGEGAGRAEPPLGKFPRQLRTQGAPGGPQGARLAAEAANLPPPPQGCRKGPAAWEPGVPTRGGGRRGPGGLRAPGSFPQRRRQQPSLPPRPRSAGPGLRNFPCLELGPGAPQPGGGSGGRGGGGQRSGWRETRGARGSEDGGERQSAGTAGATRQVWGCPVDR